MPNRHIRNTTRGLGKDPLGIAAFTSPGDGTVGQNTLADSSVTESKLSFTDITTADASTTKHGLLPKLSGTSTEFLDGTGNFSSISGAVPTLTEASIPFADSSGNLTEDNSNLSWDTTNHKLKIGDQALAIIQSRTGARMDVGWDNTSGWASGNNSAYTFYAKGDSNASGSNNVALVSGMKVTGATNATVAAGYEGGATYGGSGTLSYLIGVTGFVVGQSGTAGSVIATGFYGQATATNGTLTKGAAYFAEVPAVSGTGGITTAYGIYIAKQKQTGVTNAYGIFQADTGDNNILAGKTAVGSTTTPAVTVDVTGQVRVRTTTVSSLPSASTAGAGAIATVSDADTPAIGDAVTGSGSSHALVESDGTNWNVVASPGVSGSGTSSVDVHPGWVSGQYYTGPFVIQSTSISLATNTIYAHAFFAPISGSFTKIAVHCQTSAAGTTARLGIYANDSGNPGALIQDCGSINLTATGTQEITGLTINLDPGWYWLAIASSSASPAVAGCNLRSGPGVALWNFWFGSPSPDNSLSVAVAVSGSWTFGSSLPDPFPTVARTVTATRNVFLGL